MLLASLLRASAITLLKKYQYLLENYQISYTLRVVKFLVSKFRNISKSKNTLTNSKIKLKKN